jgi:hypothetical protein
MAALTRLRPGDIALAVGSMILILAVLLQARMPPSEPPASRPKAKRPSEGAPAAHVPESTPSNHEPGPAAGGGAGSIFQPNSRSISTWKDLPIHVVHRPHWLTGRAHKRLEHGYQQDSLLRSAEFNLEMMGYEAESIQRGLQMVERLDRALLAGPPGGDPFERLLSFARGGPEAGALASEIQAEGGPDAVRIRAIALLAGREGSLEVVEALRLIARSDASPAIRTAAGASLLWMGRQSEVANWVETEASPDAIFGFFESIRTGKRVLDPNRPPNVLVFRSARVVESARMVDVLLAGSAPSRWPQSVRAKMYGVATWYGGEREDVSAWMAQEYERTSDEYLRSSILFAAPELTHFQRLEEVAIEVGRTGGQGLLVRTAISSLARFETERSFRTLLELIPRADGDNGRLAVGFLGHLTHRYRREIESTLRETASNHRSPEIREAATSALKFHFGSYAR